MMKKSKPKASGKKGAKPASGRKKRLEELGKRLREIDLELSRIEKDLRSQDAGDESVVEDDMERREKNTARANTAPEDCPSEPQDEDGVQTYYRKFVTRMRKSLKR
ncbi:MAG: hypothetical protein PHG85_04650 [Candidatus Altiarchaeota archaeon]|nr:hypothetical protein [Candidatus Altiarchaeota archaeon]